MAAEGQSDRTASNVEVQMKQRCGNEFLHAETIAPIDFHLQLLSIYGDHTVDVSTVRQWVVHFSSDSSDIGSPPLIHIFMSKVCRFLFIVSENA